MIFTERTNLTVALIQRMTYGVERFASPGAGRETLHHPSAAAPPSGSACAIEPASGCARPEPAHLRLRDVLPAQRPDNFLLPVRRAALPRIPVTLADQWRTVGRHVDLIA